jgi:hypothetical protein
MPLEIGRWRFDCCLSARRLLVGSLCVLAAHVVEAEERTITAIGQGTELCSAWTESRKDGYSAGYGDWLLGYISGANVWGPTSGRDILRNRNAPELIEWVDGYCQEHPDEVIETAARKLVLALGRRAREEGQPASIGRKW